MTTYTIERLIHPSDFKEDIKKFIREEVPKINELFGYPFDFRNCSPYSMARRGYFFICRRDNDVTGMMIANKGFNYFDPKTVILQQQLLYVKPDSGRTAYHLFKNFIDLGKSEANHIITMLTSVTNIKPQTLEKLGFEKMETYYRLKV